MILDTSVCHDEQGEAARIDVEAEQETGLQGENMIRKRLTGEGIHTASSVAVRRSSSGSQEQAFQLTPDWLAGIFSFS